MHKLKVSISKDKIRYVICNTSAFD